MDHLWPTGRILPTRDIYHNVHVGLNLNITECFLIVFDLNTECNIQPDAVVHASVANTLY